MKNQNDERQQVLLEFARICDKIKDLALNFNCKGINLLILKTWLSIIKATYSEFFKVVDNMGINDAAKRYGVCSETIRNKIVELNLSPPQPVNEPKTKMLPKDTIRALDKYYGISPGVELDEIGL